MARLKTLSPKRAAFLDMIAWSEIGPKLLAASDDGYNVEVGGTLFGSPPGCYATHPGKLIQLRPGLASTAAGRYQLLSKYYGAYCKILGLDSFSPENQDAIAAQQIRERGAWSHVDTGDIAGAINLVSNIWASLPGNDYGQHTNQLTNLASAYVNALGRYQA